MSNKMRWRYGDTNPVVAAVDSDTVIEIGGLVWQDTDNAKPANHIRMSYSNLSAARSEFRRLFLGVVMQRSHDDDTSPVRVATTGVFEFDCPSGTFELGNLIGIDGLNNGTLLNQQVIQVGSEERAIGRVARRQPTPTTIVLVDIRSTVMTGGV